MQAIVEQFLFNNHEAQAIITNGMSEKRKVGLEFFGEEYKEKIQNQKNSLQTKKDSRMKEQTALWEPD